MDLNELLADLAIDEGDFTIEDEKEKNNIIY